MSEYDPSLFLQAIREERELHELQKLCAVDGHQTSEESWIKGQCSRCRMKIVEKDPVGYR